MNLNIKNLKRNKILYIVSGFTIFLLGAVAASSYSTGSLISYLTMLGAIVVALAISWGMLKLLFHEQAEDENDELKFEEFAKDEEDIKKSH